VGTIIVQKHTRPSHYLPSSLPVGLEEPWLKPDAAVGQLVGMGGWIIVAHKSLAGQLCTKELELPVLVVTSTGITGNSAPYAHIRLPHPPPLSARFMTRVFFGCLGVKHTNVLEVPVGFNDETVQLVSGINPAATLPGGITVKE
jgi:hypothetical protein